MKSNDKNTHNYYTHTFEPVYDSSSRILILGTFPSVKSREQGFYYGHPQNRFWRLIAGLTNEAVPCTVPEKKKLLLDNNIAIWDVVKSCRVTGSSDSSITEVEPAPVAELLRVTPISRIYANGGKAYELYYRYCYEAAGLDIIKLPSTSPANAAYGMDRLLKEWSVIL